MLGNYCCGSKYSRAREKPTTVHPAQQTQRIFVYNGGEPTVSVIASSAPRVDGTVMADVVTRCYKKIERQGLFVFNPCTKTTTTTTDTSCDYQRNAYIGDYSWEYKSLNALARTQQHVVVATPEISGADAAIQAASLQAFANLQDSVAHALVDLGEARETLRMLRNPYKQFGDYLRNSFPKKRKTSAKRRRRMYQRLEETPFSRARLKTKALAEVSSSVFLETNLGWMPAIRAVEDISEAFARDISNRHVVTGRGYKELSEVSQDSTFTLNPLAYGTDPGPGARIDIAQTRETREAYRAGVTAIVQGTDAYNANRLFGLRLLDIPSAIWDLVPYSFIVDRVFTIGDWLKAHVGRLDFNVDIQGSWLTTRRVETTINTVQYHGYEASGVDEYDRNWSVIQTPGITTSTDRVERYIREIGLKRPSLPALISPMTDLYATCEYLSLLYQKLGNGASTRTWRL